jgi:hypothetical protein
MIVESKIQNLKSEGAGGQGDQMILDFRLPILDWGERRKIYLDGTKN